MKQISGHVLVKEVNLGIPDLIVAAYDSGKPIHEPLRCGPDGKGLSLEGTPDFARIRAIYEL